MRKNNNIPKTMDALEQLFYKTFSETAEARRSEKSLKQNAFLETTGITDNKISKIERNRYRPTAFEYEQIQYFLDFDFSPYVDDLFKKHKTTSHKANLIDFVLNEIQEEDAQKLLSIGKLIFKKEEENNKWKTH